MLSFNIIGLPVLEKKIFKGFYHIWAWLPSWSCDLDHLYNFLSPLPKEALIGHVVLKKKSFENRGNIHVYSPGAGADNSLG